MTYKHVFIVTSKGLLPKNGATVYFHHLAHTLKRQFGHDVDIVDKEQYIPGDHDFIWFQSEWYNYLKDRLILAMGKKICLLGHFIVGPHNFPDPNEIEADYFVSMWKGPAVDAINKDVIYFPHGYCTACEHNNAPTFFDDADILWTGNKHAMRDENVLDMVDFVQVFDVEPEQLDRLYKMSRISLNLHGDNQKGVVTGDYLDKPAYALNERFFHIIGAGGYQVCDKHPLIEQALDGQVLQYDDYDELIELIDPMNYLEGFYENLRHEVLTGHTYKHRLTDLFNTL